MHSLHAHVFHDFSRIVCFAVDSARNPPSVGCQLDVDPPHSPAVDSVKLKRNMTAHDKV